jgi:hypothetical protein
MAVSANANHEVVVIGSGGAPGDQKKVRRHIVELGIVPLARSRSRMARSFQGRSP